MRWDDHLEDLPDREPMTTEQKLILWRAAAWVLAIVLIVVIVMWAWVTPGPPRCEEDMACWNCHTMGNRICGPTTS